MLGKKGFTLIELLVVIIIVGILASVTIPIIRGNLDRARGTEAVAALGSVRTAERIYFAEHTSYTDSVTALGINTSELGGTYYDGTTLNILAGATTFTANIQGSAGGDAAGESVQIDQDGAITDTF